MSRFDVITSVFIFMALGFFWFVGRAEARAGRARGAELARLRKMTPDMMWGQFAAIMRRYEDLMRDLSGIQGDLEDARMQLRSALQAVEDLRGQLEESPAPLERRSGALTADRAGRLHEDLLEVIETIAWVGKVTGDSLDKHGQDEELDMIRLAFQEPPGTASAPDPGAEGRA